MLQSSNDYTPSNPATFNILPTAVNLHTMHLSQYFLQMLSCLTPLLHLTTRHNNIHMVSDTAQL